MLTKANSPLQWWQGTSSQVFWIAAGEGHDGLMTRSLICSEARKGEIKGVEVLSRVESPRSVCGLTLACCMSSRNVHVSSPRSGEEVSKLGADGPLWIAGLFHASYPQLKAESFSD